MVLALKDTADFPIPTKNIVDNDNNFNYTTAGSINAYDRTYLDIINASRTKFFPPDKVLIERSTDGGSTWTTVSTSTFSNENRGKMMSDIGASLNIGTGNPTTSQQLRITLQYPGGGWYCSLDRAYIRFSMSGHTTAVTIQASTYGAQSTYTDIAANQSISGWPGDNMVKFASKTAWGTNASYHLYNIRFIFKYTAINSSYASNQANVSKISMFGKDFWGTTGTPRYAGHLYNWDYLQNVTFPAKVTSTNFTAPRFTATGDTFPHIAGNGSYLTMSQSSNWGSGNGCVVLDSSSFRLSNVSHGTVDLGNASGAWRNLYLTGSVYKGSYTYTLPNKSGTIALTSDTPPLPNNIAYIGSEVAGGGALIQGSDIDWSTIAYSSAEQVVGKWIDNKIIYRQIFQYTLSGTGWNTVGTITGIGDVIRIYGAYKRSNGIQTEFPRSTIDTYIETNGVIHVRDTEGSGGTVKCIVEYTKSN